MTSRKKSIRGTLAGRSILITAGPTWAPVDRVRVLSNISTGQMGLFLAGAAQARRMRVDLVLGPVGKVDAIPGIRVWRYEYFDQLKRLLFGLLSRRRYDFILHAAAVSDFLPVRRRGKISSDCDDWELKLRRAPKLVSVIRRLAPEACLVIFKLEAGVSDAALKARAASACQRAGADFVVANTYRAGKYQALIMEKDVVLDRRVTKLKTVKALFAQLRKKRS